MITAGEDAGAVAWGSAARRERKGFGKTEVFETEGQVFAEQLAADQPIHDASLQPGVDVVVDLATTLDCGMPAICKAAGRSLVDALPDSSAKTGELESIAT